MITLNNFAQKEIASSFVIAFLSLMLVTTSFAQTNPNFGKQGNAGLVLKKEVSISESTIFGCDFTIIDKQNILLILSTDGIIFFNIDKGTILKTLEYPDKGIHFNSIRNIAANRIMLGSGMPFVHYLIDYSGKTIQKYDLDIDLRKNPTHSAPHLEFSYSTLIGESLIISGSMTTIHPVSAKTSALIEIDIKTGKKSYFFSYPDEYKQNRGGMQNNSHYLCTNSQNQVIISFPACNDVIIYEPETKKTFRKNAGSSKISKLTPSALSESEVALAKEQYNKYFFTTPSYEQIIFDQYRELYFRIAFLPNPNYGKADSFFKPRSIAIFDKDFNFLGEATGDPGLINLFAYPNGVLAICRDKTKNKNSIQFYEIKK